MKRLISWSILSAGLITLAGSIFMHQFNKQLEAALAWAYDGPMH